MSQLAPPLQAILDAELAAGNSISDISNWPPKCELLLSLRYKFKQAHLPDANVSYRIIDDIHYWYAEYDFNDGQQIVTCGFA